MANTFKNATAVLTTSLVGAYTCPVGTNAVIHAIHISNAHVSTEFKVDLVLNDNSKALDFNIGKNVPVASGNILVINDPINLEANDTLKLSTTDTGTDIHAVISVLEIV